MIDTKVGTITTEVPEVKIGEDEDPCDKNMVDTKKVITSDNRDFLKRKLKSLKDRLLAAPLPEAVGAVDRLSTDLPALPEAKRVLGLSIH